jgi:hypothetical protein
MSEDFDLEGTLDLFCDFLVDTGFRSYSAKVIPLSRKFNAWLREKHPKLSFIPSYDMKKVFEAWGGSFWNDSLYLEEDCVCPRCGGSVKGDTCSRCHYSPRDAPVKADPDTANLGEFLEE